MNLQLFGLRLLFLWAGLICLAVSFDFSNVQMIGLALVGMALMPDD